MPLPMRPRFRHAMTLTQSPRTTPLLASQLRPDLPPGFTLDAETKRLLAQERRRSAAKRGWVTRRQNEKARPKPRPKRKIVASRKRLRKRPRKTSHSRRI